jgi:hypothetical protein
MINDNDNSNSTASSLTEYPRYRGPTKLVWEHGLQIRKPDLSLLPTTNSGRAGKEFEYQKTLQDSISKSDETRFSQLKDDESKYQFISNMITGEGSNSLGLLFPIRYVHGDPRSLIQILEDLIEQKKIWLNPQNGNLYSYECAIKERMISFPCRNCSKVLFSET